MYFVIKNPIILEKEDKSVKLYPAKNFKITYTIAFDHNAIGTQTFSIDLTEKTFEEEICRARTFGFLHELEYMKFYGLAKGGSLDNAVVIDQNGVMNEEGLRFADEFVRHKILDCIGDFSLLGRSGKAHPLAAARFLGPGEGEVRILGRGPDVPDGP